MPKIKLLSDENEIETDAIFECPACKSWHPIRIKSPDPSKRPIWEWNGDIEKPTFSPSLLVYPHTGQPRCHCFVREGRIEFCSDCDHELAGQTVEMVELE